MIWYDMMWCDVMWCDVMWLALLNLFNFLLFLFYLYIYLTLSELTLHLDLALKFPCVDGSHRVVSQKSWPSCSWCGTLHGKRGRKWRVDTERCLGIVFTTSTSLKVFPPNTVLFSTHSNIRSHKWYHRRSDTTTNRAAHHSPRFFFVPCLVS